MILVMISICLSRYFGDGPLFPENGFEENYCKDTWWKNLLYINNLFEKSVEMAVHDCFCCSFTVLIMRLYTTLFLFQCFGVSWYLANDMQFFVLSPLMLIPLYL